VLLLRQSTPEITREYPRLPVEAQVLPSFGSSRTCERCGLASAARTKSAGCGERQSGTTRTKLPGQPAGLLASSASIARTAIAMIPSSYGGPHSAERTPRSPPLRATEKKLPLEPNGASVSANAEQKRACRRFIGEAKHSKPTPKSAPSCAIAPGGVASCQPLPSEG